MSPFPGGAELAGTPMPDRIRTLAELLSSAGFAAAEAEAAELVTCAAGDRRFLDALADHLARLGYVDVAVLVDDDGDVRGVGVMRGAGR